MLTLYMTIWSLLLITTLAIFRIRRTAHLLFISLVTVVTLIISQTFFAQLALSAGATPSMVLSDLTGYITYGPLAWLGLFFMPLGWMGPLIGVQMLQQWHRYQVESI